MIFANLSISRKVTIRSSLLTQTVKSVCSSRSSLIAYCTSLSFCCLFWRSAVIPNAFAYAGCACSFPINRIVIMRSFTLIDLPVLSLVCNHSIGSHGRNTGSVSQNRGVNFSTNRDLRILECVILVLVDSTGIQHALTPQLQSFYSNGDFF